jgi:hypothetical protein
VFTVYPLPFDEEGLSFIFSAIEIYRRLQWLVIRVENEYLNNPEGYRTHLSIPQLPIEFEDYTT